MGAATCGLVSCGTTRTVSSHACASAAAPLAARRPFGVGGLGSIGFGERTELLLVESTDGCGVFDCETGDRVARDRDHNSSWEDVVRLRAAGIGPLAGHSVRMAGLHGGGLPQFTIDGWSVEIVCPDWPEASVVLSPKADSVWMEDRCRGCVKICEVELLRACGFSDSGRSLAVAESSHTLYLFHRPQPMPVAASKAGVSNGSN